MLGLSIEIGIHPLPIVLGYMANPQVAIVYASAILTAINDRSVNEGLS